MTEPAFCASCGAPRPAAAAFCPSCGKPYQATTSPAPPTPAAPPAAPGAQWSAPKEHRSDSRTRKVAIAAILVVLAIFVIGFLNRRPVTNGGTGTTTSRCVAVPASTIDAIATGLQVSSGGSLSGGQAVRSNDFDNVWMVAARIQGTDLSEVGVWAMPDINDPGPIFAVDGFASNFSDWGQAPGADITSDGAREAKACAGG